MFVRSLMNSEVTYRKSAGDIVLKPHTVTFVDETIVSAEELKACYGDRIVIIPADKEEEVIREKAGITEDETVEIAEDDIKVVTDFLNDVKNDNIPIPDGVEVDKEQLQKVIDFVEGKTDELPEGTEVITKKEADELQNKTSKDENNEPVKVPEGNKETKKGTKRGRSSKKK